jgi:hypothetical protein
VTEEQWASELADALRDTEWTIKRSGLSRMYQFCVASVCHRLTGDTVQIGFSKDDYGTTAARRAEVLRQLPSAR